MCLVKKVFYKLKLDILFNRIASEAVRLTWKPLHILTASDTISYILSHNCSIARYGDGELNFAAYGIGPNFQKPDESLQKRLIEILQTENHALLLCLPNRLNIINKHERKNLPLFWQKSLKTQLYAWTKYIDKSCLYGDTNMTRLTEGSSVSEKIQLVERIKEIWSSRNVVLVEGEKTRFGV